MIRRGFICIFVVLFMMTSTGCFGSFSLVKKVYEFNETVGDSWVQTAVMWAFIIVPVYEVSGFLDVVFCNVLEFWTGNNPIAIMDDSIIEQTVKKNGNTYHVTVGKGAVTISEVVGHQSGKTVTLKFDKELSHCTLSNGEETKTICSFHPKPLNVVEVNYPDGTTKTFNTGSYSAMAMAQ